MHEHQDEEFKKLNLDFKRIGLSRKIARIETNSNEMWLLNQKNYTIIKIDAGII
ncbi:MAG: hypothetical protein J6J36_06340 [Clostridia bacterium]|nr:hypothetical protein [Clostridia bacterium]